MYIPLHTNFGPKKGPMHVDRELLTFPLIIKTVSFLSTKKLINQERKNTFKVIIGLAETLLIFIKHLPLII